MGRYQYNSNLKDYARENRNNNTRAETIIWYLLRKRKFHGLKFVRQYPFENYIFDFYCVSKKIAIEIDGATHTLESVKQNDNVKDQFAKANGIHILRFTDEEVIGGTIEGIYRRIEDIL